MYNRHCSLAKCWPRVTPDVGEAARVYGPYVPDARPRRLRLKYGLVRTKLPSFDIEVQEPAMPADRDRGKP